VPLLKDTPDGHCCKQIFHGAHILSAIDAYRMGMRMGMRTTEFLKEDKNIK